MRNVELPDAFKLLRALRLKQSGGDREIVEVLALMLQRDEQAVLATVESALEDGAPVSWVEGEWKAKNHGAERWHQWRKVELGIV